MLGAATVAKFAGQGKTRSVSPKNEAPQGRPLAHVRLPSNGGCAVSRITHPAEMRKVSAVRRSFQARRLSPIALALGAATVFVLLTDGGQRARQTVAPTLYLGQFLEKAGLGLSEVTVKGQHMTRDSEIYDQLQLADHRSIWLYNTEAARRRVETLPWILNASVKRVFPDRLDIRVRERRPSAIQINKSSGP